MLPRPFYSREFRITADDLGESAQPSSYLYHVAHTSEARELILNQTTPLSVICNNEEIFSEPVVRVVRDPLGDFGTVHFAISPEDLLAQRYLYCLDVDERPEGSSTIRLLVSDQERPNLARNWVDPTEFNAPLHRSEKWFFLFRHQFEFIVDRPLKLASFSHIAFGRHDALFCLRYGDLCRQRDADQSVCEIMALAITRRDPALTTLFRNYHFMVGSELFVPMRLWFNKLEFSDSDTELAEPQLREGFLRLGMSDISGAIAIFSQTSRDSVNRFVIKETSALLDQSVAGVYLK